MLRNHVMIVHILKIGENLHTLSHHHKNSNHYILTVFREGITAGRADTTLILELRSVHLYY